MSESTPDLQQLLEFAIDLASEAGKITLRYFRQSFAADRKADGSFVTVADREAERYLRSRIEEHFSDDAILGEEEGSRPGSSERRWIIDPIDGTYSFVHGVPFYGVLIGLEIGGEPSIGVVNIPALGELVYAARNQGCFMNGVRVHTSSTASLDEALLLATDFGTCEKYGFSKAADELQRRVAARRTWGDCYGHVLVATGRADVMLDPIMNIWDCAPLLPIVMEAGGTFTDWRGRKIINGGNAISTNGALHDAVIEIVLSRTE